jgi:amino acid adenylation domain-containing protein
VARPANSCENHSCRSARIWRSLIDPSPVYLHSAPAIIEILNPIGLMQSEVQSESLSVARGISATESRREEQDSKLPVLSQEERHRILIEWNQTACDYPREKCLHELVEAQAEQLPNHSAVIYKNQQLAYREFNARANQLAHYLRSRGVGPNIRVAICLEPSLDFAVAVLAVLKSGGACVPLDPNYPQERLAYMLHDVNARVLITERGILSADPPHDCEPLLLAEKAKFLSGQPGTNPDSEVKPSDTAYVIYTSGSTGKPRGVLLPHAGLVNYAVNMARVYGMSPDDRVLQFCSVSFDIAVEELFIAWLSGATLVMKSEEMPLAVPEFLPWAERQGITVLDLPTAYWHEWMHHIPELKQPAPACLRLVIVGGEKATTKAYASWASLLGRRIRWINTYGPTEASIAATAYQPRADDPIPEKIPIGRPVPNVRIYLLDPKLTPVPVGTAGELHIGGAGVAQGYLNRPELTAEKFIADPFSSEPGARLYKTGDLARYLPSGDIDFIGRTDDQIKIRGFRVELGEIEFALAKHPGIREVAVVAREEVPGEKRLVAYIVTAQADAASTTELRRHLQRTLPDHMVPSTFVVLSTMPMTSNGKIDRKGLPAPEPESSREIVAATDDLESRLVKIWEGILGKKPIGIRDDFFALGGHSLLAARLMHKTGQVLGKTLPLAMLFEAPTIEQLAVALRQDGWSHYWSSLVPIQPTGSQPPFFCIHGVGGNVIGFLELGRRMKPNHPFYGMQSQGLDGKHPCQKSIEEMALHYVREMQNVQPQGPYFLGGFSFGGLVAYEMAQQLHAQGQEVGLLALFDTYPGNSRTVGTSLIDLILHPTWQHWFHDLPRVARKRFRRTFKNWFVPQVLTDVRKSNASAAEQYVLRPYPGKATLIRAAEKSLRSSADPLAAWNGLVTSLDIHEIPGDHYDILVEPHVNLLAECLKGCIDKACSEPEHVPAAFQAS